MFRNTLLASAAVFATDAATAQAPAATAAPKTVANDMDSRRVFDDVESAANYLNHCNETYSDFGSIPFVGTGIDSETGEFDPAIYTKDMRIMVATLSKKGGGVKAIVVAPIPTLDAVLADDAAREWLVSKVLDKEFNHVAVRGLREAEDVSTVADTIPTTLAGYYSGARESSGIMESFNELYKVLNETMAKKAQVWAKARLTKADLRKSFESKGYAEEYYAYLENRGEGKPSLFVVALQVAKQVATMRGLDPTIFDRWLETRDAKKFTGQEQEETEDFDIDSISAALVAEDKPAAAAAESTEQPAAE